MASGEVDKLPTSMEEWKKVESTKFKTIIQLVGHILKGDDCPKDITDPATGEFRLPEYEPPSNVKKTDKIVIYQQFTSHTALLQRVSDGPP
jgi:hypothetical protein